MQTDSENTQVQAAPHADGANGAKETDTTTSTLDLDKLYREHHTHLRHFVQRYVRNPDDAVDLVHSTFLEALRCADHFSGLSKPSTWLYGIALNLARNHVRRKGIVVFEAMEDSILEQMADFGSDPAKILELRQIAGKVETMLNEMPHTMRAAFDAVLDGEASYEEAAERLQIPIGTVRSRVSRVRAAVRAQYA